MPKTDKNIANDTRHYPEILQVTELTRKKEWLLVYTMLAGSAIATFIYYGYIQQKVIYLVAVVLYGLAISLMFKRDLDIKLGGLSSFALLLYYTLDNLWLPLHFFSVWLIGLPFAIFFLRKGFIGPLLFYTLAIVILPISAMSYVWFGARYDYSLTNITFQAEEVIYVFLPLIYIHTTLSLKKSAIPRDVLVFFGLLTFSVLLWWIVDSFVKYNII